MAKVTGIGSRGKAATTPEPAPGMSAEQQAAIDAAGEATARMGRVDRVFFWDKRQAGPDAIVCGHDKSHGKLIMHGNGSLLVCTASKNGAPCTFNQPVSVQLMGAIVLADGLESIPDAKGQSKQGGRTREVWTNADRMLFDRACRMVRGHGDKLLLRCGHDLCPDQGITLEADAGAERGAVLRCGCTDRVFSRT